MYLISFKYRYLPAFSLLELMATIAIIAALVAVALPAYHNQLNKSQVTSAMVTLASLERVAKAAYENNPSNSSISYGGVTFSNNTVTAYSAPPVVDALYIGPGGNANVASNQFLVCVYVGKLNFSGYVAPTSGNAGSYSRLCKQVTEADPIYTEMCGALQANSSDIPTAYLPQGCKCANIWGNSC